MPDVNPYQPPSQGESREIRRAHCPNCRTVIRWHQVAFGRFPVYLKCVQCKRRLVGTWGVRVQAIVLILTPLLVVGLMPLLVYYPGWKVGAMTTISVAVVTGSLLAMFNVPATLYWGRYVLRD